MTEQLSVFVNTGRNTSTIVAMKRTTISVENGVFAMQEFVLLNEELRGVKPKRKGGGVGGADHTQADPMLDSSAPKQ